MIENDNHTQLYISKIDRFLTSFDMKIIQIGPHTPELQSFENDNILQL